MAAAQAILADGETYGIHLDNMETGRARVEGELSRLRHIIREDGEYASERKKPEPHGKPADIRERAEQPEPAKPAWMPAYEALRRDWNSLIEDARQSRYPIILRQGLHGHHPAHPGIDGEPGYPGQVTGAPDPGA